MNGQEAFEAACEWIQEDLLCDMPKDKVPDVEWLAEELANRMGRRSQQLADAVIHEVKLSRNRGRH